MDFTEIALAAIGGACGALLGSLIGFALPKRTDGKMGLIGLVVLVSLSVAGGRLGPDVLEPYIGEPVRRIIAGPDAAAFEASLDRVLAEEPFFVTMQRHAPDRAESWRASVAEAYRRGGEAEASRVARQEGEVIGEWLVMEYAPRASEAALLGFYSAVTEVVTGQLAEHPQACYSFLYGVQVPGAAEVIDRLTQDGSLLPVLNAMLQLPEGAAPTPLVFDIEAAAAVQALALQAALAELGEGNSALFGQRAPANDAEYALACAAMGAYLDAMLSSEAPVDAMRSLSSAF